MIRTAVIHRRRPWNVGERAGKRHLDILIRICHSQRLIRRWRRQGTSLVRCLGNAWPNDGERSGTKASFQFFTLFVEWEAD